MFPVIKVKDVFLLLIFYYLYQTIWLLTLSIVYTAIHEEQEQIWNNIVQVINPITVVFYSIALYPISIACFSVLLMITILLNKYNVSFLRALLVSVLLIILFNILYLTIGILIGSPLKDLFNWISGNWNENIKTGLYGYVFGSIVFILLYIPLIRSFNSNKLKAHLPNLNE